MNKTQHALAALKDSTSIYLQGSQPYYIVAPGFSDKSAGIRLLHRLCSLLNQLGFEAYVEAPNTSGSLWTPQLTKSVISAHYKAGRKPIVVYPEVSPGQPLKLGLPVRYVLYYAGAHGGAKQFDESLIYSYRHAFYPGVPKLQPPAIDTDTFYPPPPGTQRDLTLVYFNRYTGPVDCFAPDQQEISSRHPVPHAQTGDLYRKAKILYAYEESAAVVEARICGCPVVLVPNQQRLPAPKDDFFIYGTSGLAWGLDPEGIEKAQATAHLANAEYFEVIAGWREELTSFIQTTQDAANAAPMDTVWPEEAVDNLPHIERNDEELAQRADRVKQKRLHQQYAQWCDRTTLRELDAQEYAEHWVSPQARPLTVLIDHLDGDDTKLADTLDSLANSLGHPAHVVIRCDAPVDEVNTRSAADITWVSRDLVAHQAALEQVLTEWIVIVRAGDRLTPAALAEWSMHLHDHPDSILTYSDEDVWINGTRSHPYFKPDLNVELLKCTNFIGSTVVVNTLAWWDSGWPSRPHELYAWCLELASQQPQQIKHIDQVLFHGGSAVNAEDENAEFTAITGFLAKESRQGKATPCNYWGTWLVHYPVAEAPKASLVVPTGIQVGYLSSLLEGIRLQGVESLCEVILVCHPDHRDEVEQACTGILDISVQVVTSGGDAYNHAAALNLGVAAATSAFVVVADDDTEPLHTRWLSSLLGFCMEDNVGCVAPRLLSAKGSQGKVSGGPLVLGVNGTYATYTGEEGWLHETGPYSRLQLTQDVSAVAGHFFVFKRADWQAVGGFDADRFPLRHGVVDFCLRLQQLGKRHVWTPVAGVLHHGGKTLEVVSADPHGKLSLVDTELLERARLVEQWSVSLANDRYYNRHLSLLRPHDIESDIVIDWVPGRAGRTKVLALPVHSGAGQYRVIEPLHALQDAGMVRSSVILPLSNRGQRILQPLELLRARPDILFLQYAMSDHQLIRNAEYKKVLPGVRIIQSVDDLYGNVPEKHPNRSFQQREGHRRMMQAISSSDELIVTTEPLAEHYRRYAGHVEIVPNALTDSWFELAPRRNPHPERLRVGWVGAQQHKGDLELIQTIVQRFADRVDWIFMGMCIDEIKPYVREVHPFVSISEYPAKMAQLGLDIAIAPLEDNHFNRCKSNLRLLEYGAMGWPVVCSDVYPYRTDHPPVIRCSDTQAWIDALEKLIAEPALRQDLGRQLHEWVDQRYRLRHWLPSWSRAFEP